MRGERKKTAVQSYKYKYVQVLTLQAIKKIQVAATIPISVAEPGPTADIYHSFPLTILHAVLPFSSVKHLTSLSSLPSEMTQTFILEISGPTLIWLV